MASFQRSEIPVFRRTPGISGVNSVVDWHLTVLPEDILGTVCSSCGLEGVVRLFATGSLVLRQKLVSPRCRIELRHNSDIQRSWSTLPKLIRELKGVTGLSMVGAAKLKSMPSLQDFPFENLPLALETLCYTHPSAFNLPEAIRKRPIKNLTSLSLCDRFKPYSSNPDPLLSDLCLVGWPFLRFLTLEATTPVELPLTRQQLPPSLESLKLVNFHGVFTMKAVQRMPLLRVLEIPHFQKIYFDLDCIPFPKAITALDITNCSLIGDHSLWDSKLASVVQKPDSLVNFFLVLPGLSRLAFPGAMLAELMKASSTMQLPPFWENLTHLNIVGLVTRAFPLPPRLLSLMLETPLLKNPALLPRTILHLSLPKTRLMENTFQDLPPKLSKLHLDTNLLVMNQSDADEGLKLRFPTSLTHVVDRKRATMLDPEITLTEENFLHRLPDTVLLYEASHTYVRIPDRIPCTHASKFAHLDAAIFSNQLEVAEYIYTNYYDQIVHRTNGELVELAISVEAVKGLTWLLDKIRRLRTSDYLCSLFEQNEFLRLILEQPCRLAILQAFVEAGCPATVFRRDFYLATILEIGDNALLKWAIQVDGSYWRTHLLQGSLLTKLLIEDYSLQIVDILLSHGVLTINLAQILCASLKNASLQYLELLKHLSSKWQLTYCDPPDARLSQKLPNSKDPFFILELLEWLVDPSNQLNVPIEQDWLSVLFATVFDLAYGRYASITRASTDIDAPQPDPPLVDAEDPYPLDWTLIETTLGKIPTPEYARLDLDQLLMIAKFMLKQGVNVLKAADDRQSFLALEPGSEFLGGSRLFSTPPKTTEPRLLFSPFMPGTHTTPQDLESHSPTTEADMARFTPVLSQSKNNGTISQSKSPTTFGKGATFGASRKFGSPTHPSPPQKPNASQSKDAASPDDKKAPQGTGQSSFGKGAPFRSSRGSTFGA